MNTICVTTIGEREEGMGSNIWDTTQPASERETSSFNSVVDEVLESQFEDMLDAIEEEMDHITEVYSELVEFDADDSKQHLRDNGLTDFNTSMILHGLTNRINLLTQSLKDYHIHLLEKKSNIIRELDALQERKLEAEEVELESSSPTSNLWDSREPSPEPVRESRDTMWDSQTPSPEPARERNTMWSTDRM